MSKILRLNLRPTRLKNPGGNSRKYDVPLNLDAHKRIKEFLESINPYSDSRTFYLLNKPTKTTINSIPSFIPAPRKRFDENMKFIFGENNLFYDTTIFLEEKLNLVFLYFLTFDQIDEACKRLEFLNIFLLSHKVKSENISTFFIDLIDDKRKHYYMDSINNFAKKNNIKNFSYQKIVSYLSSQYSIFLSLESGEKDFISDGVEEELMFCSSDLAKIGKEKLEKLNVSILSESIDRESLLVKGNVSKESNIKLEGLIKKRIDKKIDVNNSEKIVSINKIKGYSSHELENIVGIIDGGIQDGKVKETAFIYEDSITMGFSNELPKGTHAEEVASIAMFANDLSVKTEDKLKNPKVAIFNVINSNTSYFQFKNIIERIVIKYYKTIKIWNLSVNIPVEASIYEVSDFGVFLDKIQKRYDVLFVVSNGNLDGSSSINLLPPSDSFRAISVSSVNSKISKTTYARKGRIGVHSFKPDVSIFGGDIDDRITIISGNIPFTSSGGTSFSTPLISRLVVNLLEENFSLVEIPAIISAYSSWLSLKHDKKDTEYFPAGFLNVDNTELFNLIKNKLMFVSEISLSKDYRQGLLNIKFPKYDNGYDFNFVTSINVDCKLAKNSTFEYVLDSSRIRIGRVNPFKHDNINNDSNWIFDFQDIPKDFPALTETMQRIYKGKYKNRDILISVVKRNRSALKTMRSSGEQREIDNWGIIITRDMIDGYSRSNSEIQKMGIALIAESKNMNFYNEFIRINNHIVNENIVAQNIDAKSIVSNNDEIKFI